MRISLYSETIIAMSIRSKKNTELSEDRILFYQISLVLLESQSVPVHLVRVLNVLEVNTNGYGTGCKTRVSKNSTHVTHTLREIRRALGVTQETHLTFEKLFGHLGLTG